MTTINFYKISDGNLDRFLLVCKIAAKAYLEEKLPVFIYTETPEQTKLLDELLWSYNTTAFLPHSVDPSSEEQIVISSKDDPGNHHGLLINLNIHIPGWVSRFERAIEIVYDDQPLILAKRKNFEFYKKRGYPLNYFDLTKSGAH